MDPLNLQNLVGGTGGTAQSLVLLDFNVQRRLCYDGGLSRLGGLFLQTYTTTKSQGSNANQSKRNKVRGSAELTLGFVLLG